MNMQTEFNEALSVLSEKLGANTYNAIVETANENLDSFPELSMSEAVALAAVTLSDDGIISEDAYNLTDALMEHYETQEMIGALAESLDEETYETIMSAAGQVISETGCDIGDALYAVMDEAGLEYGPVDEAVKRTFTVSDASAARRAAALADITNKGEPQPEAPNTPKKGIFSRAGGAVVGGARRAGGAVANAGRAVGGVYTGKNGRLAQGAAIGGTALAVGGTALAVRHAMKKRAERKAAEEKYKKSLKGRLGIKPKNESANDPESGMRYLMECAGYQVN